MNSQVRAGLVILMIVACTIATTTMCLEGHGMPGHHGDIGHAGHPRHGAGGPSGWIAALLLVIANFTVVLSIALKTSAKWLSSANGLKQRILKLEMRQKQQFRRLHYWLNPVAIAAAILHFLHSRCASTIFPELGLSVMILISVLGMLIWLKLAPASIRKLAFRLHTSPILFLATISILLIGHTMIDG